MHTCCDGVVVWMFHDVHGVEGRSSDVVQRGVGFPVTAAPTHDVGGKSAGQLQCTRVCAMRRMGFRE